MKTKQTFEESLRKCNLSENTISSYLWTIQYFEENYDGVTKENLLAYKGYLMEYFKPKTVNLRIQAINKYLDYKSDTGNFYLLRIDNDTKKHDIYFQGHRKYAYNVFTITNEDAKSWTKKYLSYERYVEIFGEPEK